MNLGQVVTSVQTKLAAALERFRADLKSLRTGRANAAMLDGVMVEAYGTPMPLNQVATIAVPEAQLLQVTPFDPSNLQAIVTALRSNQALGLNPSDDGHVIRLPIPALTEERRREIAKQIGEKLEDCMVRMRAARHEGMDGVAAAKKSKELGEDEAKRLEKQIDEAMNSARSSAEAAAKSKEAEILSL